VEDLIDGPVIIPVPIHKLVPKTAFPARRQFHGISLLITTLIHLPEPFFTHRAQQKQNTKPQEESNQPLANQQFWRYQ
jgi:hypothetical protein